MCKVYTGYCGTSEIEHGLCACTVDNPLAKARDYLSVQAHKPCSISHIFCDFHGFLCFLLLFPVQEIAVLPFLSLFPVNWK